MHKRNLCSRVLGLTASACCFVAWSASHAADPIQLPLDTKASSVTFVGESFLHDFHGEAKEFSGNVALDPEASPPIQHASLSFATTQLTTFQSTRDKKMLAWLNVDVHPVASLQLDKVKAITGGYATADANHPASFEVIGAFSLNGRKQPLASTASGWRDKDRLIVSGETTIDTLKYGLPQIREAFMTVGTNVKVTYKLSFALPPEYAMK